MKLTLAEFSLYVVGAAFLLVLIIAMTSHYLHHRVEKRSLSRRVICRLCLNAFEDTSHLGIVDCPACGAANEKGRSRKLG